MSLRATPSLRSRAAARRRRERLVRSAALAFLPLAIGVWTACAGEQANGDQADETAPPDLRLTWSGADEHLAPIVGSAGDEVVLGFALANAGAGGAYGASVRAATALGPAQPPVRFIPGPESGRRLYSAVRFTLEPGQTEVCLEARLVRRTASEPREANPADNRVCRPIRLAPVATATSHRAGGR